MLIWYTQALGLLVLPRGRGAGTGKTEKDSILLCCRMLSSGHSMALRNPSGCDFLHKVLTRSGPLTFPLKEGQLTKGPRRAHEVALQTHKSLPLPEEWGRGSRQFFGGVATVSISN